jgi:inorganic phosphate transporter, PiT family
MVGSGAGVQRATVWQIAAAWVLTLPATIALSAGLFYLFSHRVVEPVGELEQ